MKINREQLNAIHNALKSLVGEQGAFILLSVKPDGELGEDLQIRIVGPDTRLKGLLEIAGGFVGSHLKKKAKGQIQSLPTEPD